MSNADCVLCQFAATPIAERPTKTFFSGTAKPWAHCIGKIEVVRDTNLDDAPDRLLCYATEHAPYELCQGGEYGSYAAVLLEVMEMALNGIAAIEWPESDWDIEVTMRTCPQHGWHCHARKRS